MPKILDEAVKQRSSARAYVDLRRMAYADGDQRAAEVRLASQGLTHAGASL